MDAQVVFGAIGAGGTIMTIGVAVGRSTVRRTAAELARLAKKLHDVNDWQTAEPRRLEKYATKELLDERTATIEAKLDGIKNSQTQILTQLNRLVGGPA